MIETKAGHVGQVRAQCAVELAEQHAAAAATLAEPARGRGEWTGD